LLKIIQEAFLIYIINKSNPFFILPLMHSAHIIHSMQTKYVQQQPEISNAGKAGKVDWQTKW
jgi:hypothetical protein